MLSNVYILPAAILSLVLVYYVYGAIDRWWLSTWQTTATVIDKTFTPGSTTYWTNIAGGRTWTQSKRNPDIYAISIKIDSVLTVGLVNEQTFDLINIGDLVNVKVSTTRIGRKLRVVEISK